MGGRCRQCSCNTPARNHVPRVNSRVSRIARGHPSGCRNLEVHPAFRRSKIGVEAMLSPLLKQRGARALHGHTHGVLSAGAGLAAQYSVQGAAHLHGHTHKARCPLSGRWPRSTILATVRRRAVIHNARRILLLCHVTPSVPLYFGCPKHAPHCLRSVRPGTPRAPVASSLRGGPSSAPCLSGFWSRHRNTTASC